MKKRITIILVFFLVCSGAAYAGIFTNGATELAEELFNKLVRTGGQEAINEISEYGGKIALKGTIEKVSEKYGEITAKKFVKYGKRFGISAIRVMERDPARYIKAFDGVPENLMKRAVWAAEREPDSMTNLVRKYGSDALLVAARQRGTATTILDALGKDGIRFGKALTERQGIILGKNADYIAKLPSDERTKVINAIFAAPGRILDYMEKHPKILRTTAGVGVILAIKNEMIGKNTIVKYPDGRVVETRKRGLFTPVIDMLCHTGKLIGIIIAVLICFLGVIRILFLIRYYNLQYRLKTSMLRENSRKSGLENL